MKTRFAALAAVAAAIFGIGAGQPSFSQTRELGAAGELLDGIAAIVDEGVVLKSELAARLDLVMQNLQEQQAQLPPGERPRLPPTSVIEQQVLDQLVLRQVQLQRAERLGIVVNDDLLNQALASVAANSGLTLEELPAALAAENIDYAMFRQDSREDLILEQLQQRDVISRITITPRELDQCLSRSAQTEADAYDYNISHILISVPASATPQDVEAARRRIEEIHDRLTAGEDFARLAIATSQAQTALDGGNLGWRKGSQLPTLFAPTVIRMQPGQFSAPIQSGAGFQIVKLNDMRGAERMMIDQLEVRHILLRPNEILDDAATQQKLVGIRDQLLRGDDFAAIAESVSEDPVSAAEGGMLGWVSPGDFVPEFEEKLASLPLRTLSEPFQTRFGWHIVEVLDRRSYDTTDEIKEQQCIRQIRAGKAEEERELWLRRLRDQSFVDIRL